MTSDHRCHLNGVAILGVCLISATILISASMLIGCNGPEDKPTAKAKRDARASEPIPANKPTKKTSAPKFDATAELKTAQTMIADGQLNEAEKAISGVLLREPKRLGAIILLARLKTMQGDPKTALDILDETIAERPDRVDLLQAEAVDAARTSSDSLELARRCDAVFDRDKTNSAILREAAGAYNKAGHRFDANERLRTLACISPLTNIELLCLLASDDVVFEFDLESEPTPSQALGRALTLSAENRFSDAIAVLRSCQQYQDQSPAVMATFGRLLTETSNWNEAQQWVKKENKSWQHYPDYWIAVGNLNTQLGDVGRAADAYLNALTREPTHITAMRQLAQAISRSGSPSTSTKILDRARQLGDLLELARGSIQSPSNYAQTCNILDRELSLIGHPLQALAWRFNGAASSPGAQVPISRYLDQSESLCQSEASDALFSTRFFGLKKPELLQNIFADHVSFSDSPNTQEQTLSFPAPMTPDFSDVSEQAELTFQYRNAKPVVTRHFLLHQALGGGIACLDFDLNGSPDLYLCQGGSNPPTPGTVNNLLSRHIGERFTSVTEPAFAGETGYSMGVTAGDLNQDGFPDIIVGNMFANSIKRNQGDGTFILETPTNSWQDGRYTTGLAVADVTGDHLPDIVEVNYVNDDAIFNPIQYNADGSPVRLPGPMQFTAAHDRVFVNSGDGFSNRMTFTIGLADAEPQRAMGLVVGNLDADPANEIFVANDQTNNQLWDKSNPNATIASDSFVDTAVIRGVAAGIAGGPLASMGIAAADFDDNGMIDFHVTNFDDELSNLYCQRASGTFEDRAITTSIDQHSRSLLGFGTQAIDYDNNGTLDLVVGNGAIERPESPSRPFEMPTQVLSFDGLTFTDNSAMPGKGYFGRPHLVRAIVRLDWNHDGRQDFVAGDLFENVALLENRTNTDHNWMQIHITGTTCERDAIGARIRLRCGDRWITRHITTGDGYMSKNQNLTTIGIGGAESIDELQIIWPTGETQAFADVKANRRLLVIQGVEDLYRITPSPLSSAIRSPVN